MAVNNTLHLIILQNIIIVKHISIIIFQILNDKRN